MKPGTRRVLALLRDRRDGLTQLEALQAGAGLRLAARVSELRREGFDVRCDRHDGYGRYRLVEQLEVGL